jgi:hypothetical protein
MMLQTLNGGKFVYRSKGFNKSAGGDIKDK